MHENTVTQTTRTGSAAETAGLAALAVLVGAFMILGVGFAHPEAIHNAAHDSRHSMGFPCH
jgi:cobalt transporter subunit CbtB